MAFFAHLLIPETQQASQVNLAQFFLCVLYGPETIYSGARISSLKGINSNAFRRQYLTLSRVDPKILGYLDLVEPFLLLAKRKFFLAVLAYAVSFNFVFVMLPIEMSIIYGGKFHLNPQKIGLNYLGVFVGYCTSLCPTNLFDYPAHADDVLGLLSAN